jgi:hypothetical protein
MLQYSLKLDSGRCAFADRQGFRLEMTWRRVTGAPDFDRMLSDYLAKLADEGMEGGHRIEQCGFQGLKGVMDGQTITRFGRFAADASCIVELVLPWPDGRDKHLEQAILQSFHEVVADESGYSRWRALGMDVNVPVSLKLGSCRVEPAHVEWRFMDRHDHLALRFARRGMVKEWMDQSVQSWLERDVKPGRKPPPRWRHERIGGHAVDRVEGRTLPSGWLRRTRPLTSEAWICQEDGRLYSWVAEQTMVLPERPLKCCGGE